MAMGGIAARLLDYLRLARFDRPAGGLLLLWPTLWGLWAAADGFPGWKWLAVFVAGVFIMRAFGCCINDMMDADLDAAVWRTRARPLAAGRISRREAAGVAMFFLSLAAGLWYLLPPVAKGLALLAAALAVLYPLAKRFTPLPQAVLAIVFGMGIPLADATVNNAAPSLESWGLFAANFLWILAYDTIYAMADREDDRAFGGVHSAALLFGKNDVKIIGVLYAATVLWLSALGIIFNYSVSYQIALIAAMLSAFSFWRLYKTRNPRACMAAFRANHWFGLFVFAGIVAGV